MELKCPQVPEKLPVPFSVGNWLALQPQCPILRQVLCLYQQHGQLSFRAVTPQIKNGGLRRQSDCILLDVHVQKGDLAAPRQSSTKGGRKHPPGWGTTVCYHLREQRLH